MSRALDGKEIHEMMRLRKVAYAMAGLVALALAIGAGYKPA